MNGDGNYLIPASEYQTKRRRTFKTSKKKYLKQLQTKQRLVKHTHTHDVIHGKKQRLNNRQKKSLPMMSEFKVQKKNYFLFFLFLAGFDLSLIYTFSASENYCGYDRFRIQAFFCMCMFIFPKKSPNKANKIIPCWVPAI